MAATRQKYLEALQIRAWRDAKPQVTWDEISARLDLTPVTCRSRVSKLEPLSEKSIETPSSLTGEPPLLSRDEARNLTLTASTAALQVSMDLMLAAVVEEDPRAVSLHQKNVTKAVEVVAKLYSLYNKVDNDDEPVKEVYKLLVPLNGREVEEN